MRNTSSAFRLVASKFRKSARVITAETSTSAKGGMEGKKTALPDFPTNFQTIIITTEFQANDALRTVTNGDVGFDTEFTDRRPTKEEAYIIDMLPPGQLRKTAILGWQIVELKRSDNFQIAWKKIGLRVVQLSQNDVAWVLDMWKIQAFPTELIRILESDDMAKVGAGLIKDISVVWDDLRFEMRNLVDVGFMARLLLAQKTPKIAYSNLALQTCVEELLGFNFPKEMAQSDWAVDELTDAQITYAAQDAVACARLHKLLVPALDKKSHDDNVAIPSAWYTFNTKAGEPTRRKRAVDGTEVIWKQADCTWYGGGRFIGYP
ncbi:ribonuclease H-like domain-containing protein [Mycena crocata]|nr:ribonuclease H-like domain-containing protein [Mycena crocata]